MIPNWMAKEKEFAILSVHRHHIIISFIVASVMLLPIYHIPQFAWSQPRSLLRIMHTLEPRQSMSRLETLISPTKCLDKASPFYLSLELVKPKKHGSPPYYLIWLQLTIQ